MSNHRVYTDKDFEQHVYDAGFYIPKDGKLVPVFGNTARLEANKLANELGTSPIYVASACIGGSYTMLGPDFAQYENHDRPEASAGDNLRAAYSSLDDAIHTFRLYRAISDDPGADDIYNHILTALNAIRVRLNADDSFLSVC